MTIKHTGEVRRLFRTGLMGWVILIASVLVALILGRHITRRIRQLANAMVTALGWFEMYVPKSLVLRLIRHERDAIVISQERKVTVMFTDIQGFSTISQRLTASQVAALLNEHFALLADCIEAEDGTVDKYIGDSVMAFWGAPDEQPDQTERAIRTARAIMTSLAEDNKRWWAIR